MRGVGSSPCIRTASGRGREGEKGEALRRRRNHALPPRPVGRERSGAGFPPGGPLAADNRQRASTPPQPLLLARSSALHPWAARLSDKWCRRVLPGSNRGASTPETTSPTGRSEPALHKHLEMVQAVISRMAQNASATKAWSVSLMAAVLAFGATTRFSQWLVLVPAIAFWGLDVYYLRREKLFRRLYGAAVDGTVSLYSMDVEPFQRDIAAAAVVAFTPSVLLVHGTTTVAIGLKAAVAQGWLPWAR